MFAFLKRLTLACATLALSLPLSPASQPQVRDLEIPGWLISLAFPQRADGGREILMLVASPGEIGESGAEASIVAGWEAPPPARQTNLFVGSGGARMWSNFRTARSIQEYGWQPAAGPRLLRWDPRAEQPPQLLQDDLSPTVMAIVSAAPQEGHAEGVWLIEPGRLRHVPASFWLLGNTDSSRETVIEQGEIEPAGFLPRHSHIPLYDSGKSIWLGGQGALHHLKRDPGSNTWNRAEDLKTRISLDKSGYSLTITSRIPMPFDPDLAAPAILAEWPDSIGKQRLRVTLHELDDEGASSRDLWLRFSGPETLLHSYPVLIDDKPVLAVWTSLADKVRLHYRPRLHLFPITEDRTRAGRLPTATMDDVGEARWRLPRPVPHDANGDGKQDLLLLYRDGKRYRVDAFLQQDDLRFNPSAAVTKIDLGEVPEGIVTGFLAEDLTGDGLGDLVIITRGELLLVPGRPASRKGSRLFEKQPSTRIAMGSEDAELTLDTRQVDLDGDGRSEFIFTRWNPKTRTMHLRIIAPAGESATLEVVR